MTVRPILAGTDGTAESLHAVERAAREAALRGAALRIVSVPALPPLMSWNQAANGPTTVADTVHEACLRPGRGDGRCLEEGWPPQAGRHEPGKQAQEGPGRTRSVCPGGSRRSRDAGQPA
jgi:hypothetical protein